MNEQATPLAFEIELQPGEKLTLPPAVLNGIGAGRWLVTIQAVTSEKPIRGHDAFLRSYSAEDEGLYEDHLIPEKWATPT